jgi:type II secretory pathway component PulJ
MKRLFKNSESGFTLMETIVALGLGTLVMTAIMAVVIPGLRNIRAINRTEKLHTNAVFLLNTLTYWIKQAEDLRVPSASLLEIELPDSVKTVERVGNNIMIGEKTEPENRVRFNADEVEITKLNFTEMPKSVIVNLIIETEGGEEEFTTTIAQRNNP